MIIVSYAAKYASAFYGPFRDAAVHHVGGADDVAARLRLDQRLAAKHFDRLVVVDPVATQDAVMPVAGIGVERHVAHDADVGDRRLDGAGGAADEVALVQRLAAALVAQRVVGEGEQRDHGDAEVAGLLGGLDAAFDGEAHDARHRRHRLVGPRALAHEDRPDQVAGADRRLAHQTARPFALAHAPQAEAAGGRVDPGTNLAAVCHVA
jgi:hypothetical protein